MKTFEDLLEVVENEEKLKQFLLSALSEYKNSSLYKEAVTAYEYYRRRNTTIIAYQKMLYKLTGEKVPDIWSANFKLRNGFYPKIVRQEVSHLLGNGIEFNKRATKDRLGGAKLDKQVIKLAKAALWGGVSFGFYNLDHIDDFTALEFVPLFGEEDGALHAGIRFWQVDDKKPLRLTLFEQDGYTEYIRRTGTHDKTESKKLEVLKEKQPYTIRVEKNALGETKIIDGQNYPSFPVVPFWGNEEHQSDFVGLQETIDCYDLMKSGLANDIDDAAMIYWLIQNSGGMDDVDLAKFVERMRTIKAAYVDEDGSTADAHTVDVPFQSREYILNKLREDLFNDAMALDTDKITAGNITATAIEAAYENLSMKCDDFENCVTDFLDGILALAGVPDESPTYKRSKIMNMAEDTQMVLSAAQYLDDETILKHLPFLNPDEIKDVQKRVLAEEVNRFDGRSEEVDGQATGENGEGNPDAVPSSAEGNNE